jgi:hypothetical protein
MNNATPQRRQQLADRIMLIDDAHLLDEVDRLLASVETKARIDRAMAEVERGEGIDISEHRAKAEAWLRANGTRY